MIVNRSKTLHIRGRRRGKAAFTLVELIITIVLFAMVAGLVIAFISFMTRFNDENDEITGFVDQSAELRAEVDFWFSAFDAPQYSVTVYGASPAAGSAGVPEGAQVFATAERAGAQFSVYFVLQADPGAEEGELFRRAFVFEYEASGRYHGSVETNVLGAQVRRQRVFADSVSALALYRQDGWEHVEEEDARTVRFIVRQHVAPQLFACEILPLGNEESE